MTWNTAAIFREVSTILVERETDIVHALHGAVLALKKHMPIDQLILGIFDQDEGIARSVLRVDEHGVVGEMEELLARWTPPAQRDAIKHVQEMPDVWTSTVGEVLASFEAPPLELGIPDIKGGNPNASVIVINGAPRQAVVVCLTEKPHAYGKRHQELFSHLSEPLLSGLDNALRYVDLKKKRDALARQNEIFREVTLNLTTGEDIGAAFQRTLVYLRRYLPLDRLFIVKGEKEIENARIILQVTADGVSEIEDYYIESDEERSIQNRRMRMLEELPDTFVQKIDPSRMIGISTELYERKLEDIGLPPHASLMVLGVQSADAGIAFISEQPNAYGEEQVQLVESIKAPFVIALHNALRHNEVERQRRRLVEDVTALRQEALASISKDVIGAHDGLKETMQLALQVAATASPVLLLGETGTGKEVIAHAIHRNSSRASGPIVSLNCGAIPESLVDSELFGHEKGAFTGAASVKHGRFERADKGTLFLDEVAELPLSAQVKLLRVLQTGEFERVGGTRALRADVRLIAATHRDMEAMVAAGQFREDLWFRLNVFPIGIPPLRRRKGDIPLLVYHFIERKSREMNLGSRPTILRDEMERLRRYDWPGNVRELQNAIERSLILSRGGPLSFDFIEVGKHSREPAAVASAEPPTPLLTYKETMADYITRAIGAAGGKISGKGGAADIAGMNASTFRSKMKKLGIGVSKSAQKDDRGAADESR